MLGIALIAYGRQGQPTVDVTAAANQEYFSSFGVYKCDSYLTGFPGAATDPATVSPDAYIKADGIFGWKPQVLAGLRTAKLKTLFDLYGITVDDKSITFPSTVNGGETITEIDTKCKDANGAEKDATLRVLVWDDYRNTADSKISIASFDGVRLTGDGMAIALAFIADGVEVPQPDSSALATLAFQTQK
ncbi:MAG: hypothetical protein ABR76_07280 [Acidimicrobiia bacterium BACL6 MAG-121220-bin61]|nr:MAG: hypothetical protein ABR76_07280 [Acidimicrobiia bacterium BACL6 MAG-121220-bin61]